MGGALQTLAVVPRVETIVVPFDELLSSTKTEIRGSLTACE